MQIEQLRELQHAHFIYEITSGTILQVKTPPSKFETDDSKVKATCLIINSKQPDEIGTELIVDDKNMVCFDNISEAVKNVDDPHLYATLNYMGIVVDSISQVMAQAQHMAQMHNQGGKIG
jgi:hypothetical protein